MYKTISVNKAISRGHLLISYPTIVIIIGTSGSCIYLGVHEMIPTWAAITICGIAVALAWLLWSYVAPKWRVWAFGNVRNVHELKQRAIEEKLIWPDGYLLNKTEIWSKTDKKKWEALQRKFTQPDAFEDDLSIPDETIIPFSKAGSYIQIATVLCLIPCIILFLPASETRIYGILLIIAVFIYIGSTLIKVKKGKPPIVINTTGMSAASIPFHPWSSISSPAVVKVGSGKDIKWHLQYSCPNGRVNLDIYDYNINVEQLRLLLKIYPARNRQRRP